MINDVVETFPSYCLPGRRQWRVCLCNRDPGDGHLPHQAEQGRQRRPLQDPHLQSAGGKNFNCKLQGSRKSVTPQIHSMLAKQAAAGVSSWCGIGRLPQDPLNTFQDTLHGIENKSYGAQHRSRHSPDRRFDKNSNICRFRIIIHPFAGTAEEGGTDITVLTQETVTGEQLSH